MMVSHFNSLINNLNVSVMILKDWKVQWCNRYSEQLFQQSTMNLVGSEFESYFKSHDIYERTVSDFWAHGDLGDSYTKRLELKRKDGSIINAEVVLKNILQDDEYTGELLVTIYDQSDKKDYQPSNIDADVKSNELKTEMDLTEDFIKELNNDFDNLNGRLGDLHEVSFNAVNHTKDGVAIIQDQKILFANPRFAVFFANQGSCRIGAGRIVLPPRFCFSRASSRILRASCPCACAKASLILLTSRITSW